jgi:DNA replication protein DnaC
MKFKLGSKIVTQFPTNDKDVFVHFIAKKGIIERLEKPCSCLVLACPECGGTEHFTPFMFPGNTERLWTCANFSCAINQIQNRVKMPTNLPKPIKRPVSWEDFRDQNDIGNSYQEAKIETLNKQKHNPERREYCRKFGEFPNETLLIQGPVGRGKTHLALCICELFTRKSASCKFFTLRTLMDSWYNSDNKLDFTNKLKLLRLLVVDDFGTSLPPAGFMDFFMDVINTRIQNNDRGTIITTNLSDKNMALFCGDALADRFQTGQRIFVQGDESERVRKVL